MKRIKYTNEQEGVLKSILGLIANRVIFNFMYYILDFGDFHVLFPMELETGISLTGEQEIKYTYPEYMKGKYELIKGDKLVAESLLIENIQILKTILYWEKVENDSMKISIGDITTNKKINDLISCAFETEEEMMIKPSQLSELLINEDFVNLADVGVKIDSGNRSLVICPVNNMFGFMDYQDGVFWTEEDLSGDFSGTYDLIEVEK